MKKTIASLMMIFLLSLSSEAQVIDGVKEAARGVWWMIKVEVCKVSTVLASWAGYKCYHADHKSIYESGKK